jgi:hypothetical protein
MVLQARPLHFPAYAPLDEATRPELLEPGAAVLLAENVRPTENGGYETRRGFGYQTLARLDATNRSAGYKLFAHGSKGKQTCVVDGSYLDVYSPPTGVNVTRGRVSPFGLSYLKVPGPGSTSFTITDAVVCDTFYVACYTDGQNVFALVVDVTTGALIRAPEVVYAGGAAEVFGLLATYGANVFLVAREVNSANVKWSKLDVSSATTLNTGWSAAANLRTDGCLVGVADIAFSVESLSDRFVVLYGNNSAGTDRLTILTADTSGVIASAAIGTASTNPVSVCVQSDGTTIWAAWDRGANIYIQAVSTALATTGTSAIVVGMSGAYGTTIGTTGTIGIVSTSSTAGVCYVNDGNGSWLRWHAFTISAGAVTQSGSAVIAPNVWLYGRPFRSGGRTYAPVIAGDNANLQKRAIVADLTESVSTVSGGMACVRPVALFEPGLSQPAGVQCRCAAYGAEFWVPLSITTTGTSRAVYVARLSTVDAQSWKAVQRGETTYLTGAMVSVFDGHRITEAGFVISPPQPTTSTAAGALTGTYRYAATYEYVDAAGNWVTSGVSLPSAAETPSAEDVSINVKTLAITSKQVVQNDENVRIVLWRTTDNGTVYYRHSSKANNLASNVVTFTDATSDATLSANAQLYAPSLPGVNGGAQDRRPTGGLMHAAMYNGMLVGTLGDKVVTSGQDVPGEALWWSPVFEQVHPEGGDFTGIAVQDGTTYLFKRRAIYAVAGEAPSDNGTVGGLGVPRRLAVDVGCIDARSIVVTSLGVFFQSERGIELLTRAQSVEFVGERVPDTLGSYPVCTSATIDPVRDVVYFELAASESAGLVSGNGRTLIFDLSLKSWVSTDRRPKHDGTADTPAQAGAMIWDGTTYRYAWLQADGRVRPEQSAYYDSGSADAFIVPRVEYPPFKFGLQQRMRAWRAVWLVERYSAAGFKVEHLWDWASAYSAGDDKTWTEAQTASKRQLHWTLKTGEHQSVRFRVSATAPATLGTGRAFAFVGFSIDGAPKQGSTRGTPNLDPAGRQ